MKQMSRPCLACSVLDRDMDYPCIQCFKAMFCSKACPRLPEHMKECHASFDESQQNLKEEIAARALQVSNLISYLIPQNALFGVDKNRLLVINILLQWR
jgi:hypothetical protein